MAVSEMLAAFVFVENVTVLLGSMKHIGQSPTRFGLFEVATRRHSVPKTSGEVHVAELVIALENPGNHNLSGSLLSRKHDSNHFSCLSLEQG